MPRVDVVVASDIVKTPRVLQVSGMFDAPVSEKLTHEWHADLDIESRSWNIGLIVGPSGSGKTQIAEALFGRDRVHRFYDWSSRSMIDDFPNNVSVREISDVMNSVGFSTIPSWMKPFRVLSNGEQFRATIARKILEEDDPIVVDEFTSVVDRQVAKIASHAVQKAVRKRERKFVAVSCHSDVEDWLQPDWVFEPVTCSLRWRSVQRRPTIDVTIMQVRYDAWQIFAPFHYMSADLNKSARCFCLFIEDVPAAFAGVLSRPVSAKGKHTKIFGVSRLVTHPDYQGLGLAFVLLEQLGGAYGALGERFRMYPAHPNLVIAFEKSTQWRREKMAGRFSTKNIMSTTRAGQMGSRPCGVYEFVGNHIAINDAKQLLGRKYL